MAAAAARARSPSAELRGHAAAAVPSTVVPAALVKVSAHVDTMWTRGAGAHAPPSGTYAASPDGMPEESPSDNIDAGSTAVAEGVALFSAAAAAALRMRTTPSVDHSSPFGHGATKPCSSARAGPPVPEDNGESAATGAWCAEGASAGEEDESTAPASETGTACAHGSDSTRCISAAAAAPHHGSISIGSAVTRVGARAEARDDVAATVGADGASSIERAPTSASRA